MSIRSVNFTASYESRLSGTAASNLERALSTAPPSPHEVDWPYSGNCDRAIGPLYAQRDGSHDREPPDDEPAFIRVSGLHSRRMKVAQRGGAPGARQAHQTSRRQGEGSDVRRQRGLHLSALEQRN